MGKPEGAGGAGGPPWAKTQPRDGDRIRREFEEALGKGPTPPVAKRKPAPGAEPLDTNLFIAGRNPFSDVRPEAETWRIAYAKGYSVKYPKPYELFVDIDDEMGLQIFERGLKILREFNFNARVTRKQPSPSGEPFHFHIVVALNRDVAPLERLVYQAILGSDPKREILGVEHIRNEEEEHPTRFFEKKTGRKAQRRAEAMQKAMAVEMLGKDERGR